MTAFYLCERVYRHPYICSGRLRHPILPAKIRTGRRDSRNNNHIACHHYLHEAPAPIAPCRDQACVDSVPRLHISVLPKGSCCIFPPLYKFLYCGCSLLSRYARFISNQMVFGLRGYATYRHRILIEQGPFRVSTSFPSILGLALKRWADVNILTLMDTNLAYSL